MHTWRVISRHNSHQDGVGTSLRPVEHRDSLFAYYSLITSVVAYTANAVTQITQSFHVGDEKVS